MRTYVKLNDATEYKIKEDDQTTLLYRHVPSQGSDYWHTQCTGRQKILEIQAESDTNVKCLLEDGKWYHIGSNGFLVLTLEEREKERQEKEVNKKSKINDDDEDANEKSSSLNNNSPSVKDDSSCTKFIFTIIPILPIWWLIKLGIKSSGVLVQLLWWIIKLPFFIVSWPVRIILSCCLSQEQRRFTPEMPEMKVFPHYSFKIF